MLMMAPQWWWMTDKYDIDEAFPTVFDGLAGPQGVGAVRAWMNGTTTKGWGEQEFMPRYNKKLFSTKLIEPHLQQSPDNAFAFLMRSMRLVCIDIDGKNGGLEHAQELLGNAPPTLAETSKSGNGYHLFYEVEDDWDPQKGFAKFGDSIGIVTGVDIRATGCVYHYPQQRWNGREIAKLPAWIVVRLLKRANLRRERATLLEQIDTIDETERLMLHDELMDDLKRPIAFGKRNSTLFAVGSQMLEAKIPDWDERLRERGAEIDLSADEVEKIIANISRYSAASA